MNENETHAVTERGIFFVQKSRDCNAAVSFMTS